jgi:hypothetical protein
VRGNAGCSLNAACTNVNGTAVCACNDGFSGDGKVCTDSRPPQITVHDKNLLVKAFADAGEKGAAVDFPAITTLDDVSASAAIKVVCRAIVTPGDAERVYPKGSGPGKTTSFPVGTTTVSCVATDEAGNKSPPASFAVLVMCQPNYKLDANGVCTGEFGFP